MFRKGNTEKMSAQKLVILAFFVALYIVLERFFSFNVWNMRVGFAFIALALAGMLYGPLAAGLVGAVGDILGMLLFPTGPYFPGFTLTAFFMGLIYGLFLYKEQSFLRIVSMFCPLR